MGFVMRGMMKTKRRAKDAFAHIYCNTCKDWFDTSLDKKPTYCMNCGAHLYEMKCVRCGHLWRVKKKEYPNYCPACKSPYYNRLRMSEYRVKNIETADDDKND